VVANNNNNTQEAADPAAFDRIVDHAAESLCFDDDHSSNERHRFDDMELKENLLRGIYAHGFETPSPVQAKAIIPVVRGHDTIVQAQAGTGKTGAFAVSLLQRIDNASHACQAIVLAPTRELATQSTKVIRAIGDYLAVRCHAFIGGTRVRDDQDVLRKGCQVAVGSPGRILDLLERGSLDPRHVSMLILDEADELLSQGFSEQLYEIFKKLPEQVQVCLFSATIPGEVLEMSQRFMRNPTQILVKKEALTLAGIRQFYVDCEREEYKLDVLCDLYETLTVSQSIIFCNSRRKVDWLTSSLNARDFTVSSIHGDMESGERSLVMEEFRGGSSRVLVTTDLMARGIDVQQVSLVVNYDLPRDVDNYIHRIGRSGRHGRKGVAISFILPQDIPMLRQIEMHYDTEVEQMPQNVAEMMA